MANYICTSRTNYFHVTDEEKYKELFDGLVGGDDVVHDFTKVGLDGTLVHGFGSYGDVFWRQPKAEGEDREEDEDEPDYSLDNFITELRKILPEGEAFIYMSTGYEKLRYVGGWGWVVTRNNVKLVDLNDTLLKAAREMIGDNSFDTQFFN